MSYLVLARTSRPQRFDEVVGQEVIVRTLQNALRQGRTAHALLFSGIRGTGKTTLARLMAKAMNCAALEDAEPCNRCASCEAMNEGRSLDLHEIDGASNRGIQEIRELKEKIRFHPVTSRYKIFIIDEVHMLTAEAFNALLKTLEEPPAHAFFMFATTEAHRVPVTILSRCQRYELKRVRPLALKKHFAALARRQKVTIDESALEMIVREADGSVRDGLSLLDQVFSYAGGTVSEMDVAQMLGLVREQAIAEIGLALLSADISRAYAMLAALDQQGADLKRVGNALLHWFRSLMLCSLGAQTAALVEKTPEQIEALQQIANQHHVNQLAAMFSILMDAFEQTGKAQQPKLRLEVAFLRMAQARDMAPIADLIARFDALAGTCSLSSPTRKKISDPVLAPSAPAIHAASTAHPLLEFPDPLSSAERTPLPAYRQEEKKNDQLPPHSFQEHEQPEVEQLQEAPSAEIRRALPEMLPRAEEGSSLQRIRRQWRDYIHYVQGRQRWMGLTLQAAGAPRLEGDNTLIIPFRDGADCLMLQQKENLRQLSEYALDFFQHNLNVHLEAANALSCDLNPLAGMNPQEERRALATDPLVLSALEVFSGRLGDIRTGHAQESAITAATSEHEGQPDEE